jgi:thiamine biosynthesis lipoprotein
VAEPKLHRFRFKAMACENEIQLYAEDARAASAMARKAMAEVLRIEAKYSRYRDDSVVGRINAAAGREPLLIDDETAGLLGYADAVYQQSSGRFDITSGVLRRAWNFKEARLPDPAKLADAVALIGWDRVEREGHRIRLPQAGMEIDFGGFGKEYAVDRAADLCLASGWQHGLINLGGDLRILGPQADGRPWQIGIVDPRQPDRAIATSALSGGAMATSGDYERYIEVDGRRYCHILEPRTGYSVRAWQSVTAVAGRCLVAGSITTIAMLMGAEEGEEWLRKSGAPFFAVRADGSHIDGRQTTSSAT